MQAFRILDTGPERAFDALTGLARKQFATPIALVSLVDECRQWFKSAAGLDVTETPRDVAFCAHAIISEQPLVVEDALKDVRFADSPLVTGVPGIKFYAGAPLITSDGFRIGAFCVIDTVPRHDFTETQLAALTEFAYLAVEMMELRRMAHETGRQDDDADFAAAVQTDLFSIVAHEIRSPIAALTGLVRAFASEAFGPVNNSHYRQCSALMAETADYVMQVTDRMLDFARFRAGDVALKDERVLVADLFAAADRMTRHSRAERNTKVAVASGGNALALWADRGLVLQMLVNLVGNAIKYGPPGSTVSLAVESLGPAGLALVVSDCGRGMSADEIDAALKPYGRLSRAGEEDPGGVGIGLPLVKRLVEAHGGRLELRSAVGVGTSVRLVFPAYRVRSAPATPKDAA